MNLPTPQGVFVHAEAINESPKVGSGTRIWAFAHVLPGAKIGVECNICEHVFIENQVVIGDRVTIKVGVQIYDGVTLEDDTFIGPNTVFTNDRFPRSKQYLSSYPSTIVRRGASIGANATILPGLTIGQNSMIGAGSVVTRDVPPHAIVCGNPAVIKSYAHLENKGKKTVEAAASMPPPDAVQQPGIQGITLVALPKINDLRGSLTHAEIGRGLPFLPKRYFVIFEVPTPEIRGEHAHRELHQFMVALRGRVNVSADDGKNRWEAVLDSPKLGLHVSPYVWLNLFRFSADCVLLVLASDVYSESDYIRNYDDFERLVAGKMES
jgi:UDP-2-acetamido-3-amino-2,3-dideoxy-glucuronate N-acetyltransferase